MGNLVPSDGRKKNLLDLIRTYKKTKKILQKKPAEMEQQLKQQLMQKKIMQISRKKKESTVFSILPFAKIVLPTMKKDACTFQNDIQSYQRTVPKLFMKKKKKSVCA